MYSKMALTHRVPENGGKATLTYTTIAQALRETLCQQMARDARVFIIGEDVGKFGGAYRVTEGLYEEFGAERVRDTATSEIAIAGIAMGAALTGMRPVAEFQYNDFMTNAMDQICNHMAKYSLMSGGKLSVPVILRAPIGATGRSAQHSQSLEAWFAHTPGIKVVMPSTPYDARGLLRSAFKDLNPVLILEHKLLYGSSSPGGKAASVTGEFAQWMTPAPEEDYEIPFGVADVKRTGTDLTIVATAVMVHRVLKIAQGLEEKEGIHIEVIDPRTVYPLDTTTIRQSVAKTHCCLVVTEETGFASFAAEIAAQVNELAFDELDAPVMRVNSLHTPMPFNYACESFVLPNEGRIVQAIRELLA
jgi:acetoin:2,6-dichlorophenolindophenol oxidoreductase subunit beta